MSDTTIAPETPTPEAKPGFTWNSLLRGATVGAMLITVVTLVLAGLIPPLVVFLVLWVIGLWLVRRPGKAGPIFMLIVFLAYLGTSAPFVLPQLAVPASTVDFVIALGATLAGVTAIVSAIAVLVKGARTPSSLARALGGAVVGLFIAGVILSVVQNASFEDAELQEGDVELTTVDIEFSPTDVEGEGGEVSVFVQNDDPVLHTFTIDELDVDLDVPAGKSARITFEAEPGEYRFYCVPHQPDMEGTLTIR
jgi:plastocyanin